MTGFQFKQFFVAHDRCGMKVGTDSIMLGGWCEVGQAKKILDIGTGSGLLALMLAQKMTSDARCLAIDVNAEALIQAQENISHSPWPDAIEVKLSALQDLNGEPSFDLIVSNPPYFPTRQFPLSDLNIQNQSKARLTARQQDTLSLKDLITCVSRLLERSGQFYCVLPVSLRTELETLLEEEELGISKMMLVKPTSNKSPKIMLLKMEFESSEPIISQITIRDGEGHYTSEYKTLTKSYYLNF